MADVPATSPASPASSERFQRDEQTLSLFTYDLREYKQVPDWLNAKFWANPENFGKYWW